MGSPRISGGQGSEGSDLMENVLGHGWSLMAFTQEAWCFMSGRGGGGERRAGRGVRTESILGEETHCEGGSCASGPLTIAFALRFFFLILNLDLSFILLFHKAFSI